MYGFSELVTDIILKILGVFFNSSYAMFIICSIRRASVINRTLSWNLDLESGRITLHNISAPSTLSEANHANTVLQIIYTLKGKKNMV